MPSEARDIFNRNSVRIDPGPNTVTKVRNDSAKKVYYSSKEAVSSTSNDGTLEEGQQVTLVANTYFISEERSRLNVNTTGFNDRGKTRWHTFSANAAEGSGEDSTATSEKVFFAEVGIGMDCYLTGIEVLMGTIGAVEGKFLKAILYDTNGRVVAWNSTEGTEFKEANSKLYVACPFTVVTPVSAGRYFIGVIVKETKGKIRTIKKQSTNPAVGSKTSVPFATANAVSITPINTFTENIGPIATTY